MVNRKATANTGFASGGLTCKIGTLCSETRPNAKPETSEVLSISGFVGHPPATLEKRSPINKSEGIWNNDWEASQELIYRHFISQGQQRQEIQLDYANIVTYFQSRYRGTDTKNWNGYICHEPLLAQPSYFQELTKSGIAWGFFSGATRLSANYILEKRLGLQSPVLIAMEDAPGKPDPTGPFATINILENGSNQKPTVVYVGDTVADMHTVEKAKAVDNSRTWLGVGVLPPHVQETVEGCEAYTQNLIQAGAKIVLNNVQELTIRTISKLEL